MNIFLISRPREECRQIPEIILGYLTDRRLEIDERRIGELEGFYHNWYNHFNYSTCQLYPGTFKPSLRPSVGPVDWEKRHKSVLILFFFVTEMFSVSVWYFAILLHGYATMVMEDNA